MGFKEKNIKKILICYEGDIDTNSSFRNRIEQYLNNLNKSGFYSKLMYPYKPNLIGRLIFKFRFILDLLKTDIIFIQKTLFSPKTFFLIKLFRKKLIYDFDDALYANYTFQKISEENLAKQRNLLICTLKNADKIIVSNEKLAEFAGKYNHSIYIVPSSLDVELYDKTREKIRKNPERVYIGWMGKAENLSYLKIIVGALRKICSKYPKVEIMIRSNQLWKEENIRVNSKLWQREKEIEYVMKFDIGIMPLLNDEWTKGKSAFKAIQCMTASVPCVCSPIGLITEIIKDGENGYFANSEEEWVTKLSKLIENEKLRKDMSIRAREAVIKDFSTKRNLPKLISVLNSL